MTNVDREDVLGVASGEDEKLVQALRAHGSDPSRPFPSGWCPARDSNLRTMPPAYGRNPRVNYPCRTPCYQRVRGISVGFAARTNIRRGVSLDDKNAFYLRLRIVGGDGFEPPTPAL
jgi:hypothetical protein